MYKEQWERLVGQKALGISAADANAIVARAYGYSKLDIAADTLVEPINGLQMIKSPDEIKAIPDRSLQMMEFLRMATNMDPLQHSLPDIRKGHPQGTLIATMWGFSSFDALKTYARRDKIDPTSQDKAEMARFKTRTGFMPPAQYLLGRDYTGNTLIIHNEPIQISQWIDQEICLNRLDDLLIAVVRANPDGDDYLNRYSRAHDVFRKALSEDHSSHILGERLKNPNHHLAVTIVPNRTYTLEQLVAAHYSALSEGPARGRTLIIDRVQIARDVDSINAGLNLAKSVGINVVVTIAHPDPGMWDKFESRAIFGFERTMAATGNQQMDEALAASSPFVGKKNNNLQLAYHSDQTGVIYSIVQLVPETQQQGATLFKRIFGKPALG